MITTTMHAVRRDAETHISGNATLRCETVPKSSVIPAVKPLTAQSPRTQAPQKHEASVVEILVNFPARHGRSVKG